MQRFSGHKGRPLVKFLIITLPNGHLIALFGPYGSDNDDEITKHALEHFTELTLTGAWTKTCGVTVRGFRLLPSEIEQLVGKKIHIATPAYLHGRSQFTSHEVMHSRCYGLD